MAFAQDVAGNLYSDTVSTDHSMAVAIIRSASSRAKLKSTDPESPQTFLPSYQAKF